MMMQEVGSVLNSSEERMVDGIDGPGTEDVATEVQTVYDVSKQVLRLLLCNWLGLWKYDVWKISFVFYVKCCFRIKLLPNKEIFC